MFSFDFSPTYILTTSQINLKILLTIILAIVLCGPIQKLISSLKSSKKIIKFYENRLEIIAIVLILSISILL